MSSASSASGDGRAEWIGESLQIFALCSLAIAQPLYDLLGKNASFFVAHRASRADVLLLAFSAFVVPTLMLLAARYLISRVSKSAAHVFYLSTLALLGALALTPPIVRVWSFRIVPATALAIAIGVFVVAFVRRSRVFRRFLSALGIVSLAFPVLFLFASPVRDLLFPQELTHVAPASTKSKVPVTVVLFDELALANIITPDGDIDEERYPNLARLQSRATWYRTATTSGLRTDQAVPAILTGRRVPRRQVPSSYAYPNNLFTLLETSHDLHVHEHVTQLCPPDLCSPSEQEQTSGLASLFADAAVVYGHIVLPDDIAESKLPPLGDRWAGFVRPPGPAVDTGTRDPVSSWLRTRLIATREQNEGKVFDEFLDGLRASSKRPQLSWMHSQVPHPPWRYLPTGQTYLTGPVTPGYHDFRWSDNQYLVDEVQQRALLQSKFADRLAGRLMKRLDEAGLWDDTLLIVLADHGATWEAGKTRREIDGPQGSALVSVPLFVKYPHQREGKVDDRNAELVDVLPTIADVTGVRTTWETHGTSLLSKKRRAVKRVFDGRRDRPIEFSFADVRRRAAELQALFGAPGGPDDLFAYGRYRDLVGRRVSSFDVEKADDGTVRIADAAAYDDVDTDAAVLPALFRARFTADAPAGGRHVAVALNGTIASVGQTFAEEGGVQLSLFLSQRLFRDGSNDVEAYFIVDDDRLAPIRS